MRITNKQEGNTKFSITKEVLHMKNVKIQALDNGPFLVNGGVELTDGEGNTIDIKQETYLCRCGLSANMPFCTGAHQGKFQNTIRSK